MQSRIDKNQYYHFWKVPASNQMGDQQLHRIPVVHLKLKQKCARNSETKISLHFSKRVVDSKFDIYVFFMNISGKISLNN